MTSGGGQFYVGPDATPDKYELVQLVGGGGEAELWQATMTVDGAGETVAVKVLRGERMSEFEALSARWAEQAEMLRFVNQPGVVGVREHFEGAPRHGAGHAGETGGRALYLVMNWVEGRSLAEWVMLNPGREGLLEGLRHLDQVAHALETLHAGPTPSRRPIVHGDLSPNNIMITPQRGAVLVDFGLVRLTGHYTRQAAGTPGFAAPEVWTHGEYSPAADRYSFGALTYFAVVGEAPPPARRDVRARLFAQPILERCPPDGVEYVMRMFSDDQSERPGPVEWLRALRQGATASARSVIQDRAAIPAPPVTQARVGTQVGPAPVGAGGRTPAGPATGRGSALPPPYYGPPPTPPARASTHVAPVFAPPPSPPGPPPERRRRGLRWTVGLLTVVVALLAAFVGGSLAFSGGTPTPTAGPTTPPVTTTTVPSTTAPAGQTGTVLPPVPGPVVPPISRTTGDTPLLLSDGYEADLDSLSPNWDVAQSNDLADIQNSGSQGADLFGQRGVDLAPVTGPPEYGTCQTATAYQSYVQQLRIGQAFCVRTGENRRFAYLKVRAVDPVLSLDVVVW